MLLSSKASIWAAHPWATARGSAPTDPCGSVMAPVEAVNVNGTMGKP